jgi:hypothetical protein
MQVLRAGQSALLLPRKDTPLRRLEQIALVLGYRHQELTAARVSGVVILFGL